MMYTLLRGIFITIGITPPAPEKAKWVAVVFFGICAAVFVGMVALGMMLLQRM